MLILSEISSDPDLSGHLMHNVNEWLNISWIIYYVTEWFAT
jgi:hypothetical protein